MKRTLLLAAALVLLGGSVHAAAAPDAAVASPWWWDFPAAVAAVGLGLVGLATKFLLLGSGHLGLPAHVLATLSNLPRPGRLLGLLSVPFLPLLGLFSRINKDELLHNPVRKKVSDYVQENPGATIMEVRNALDIAWGTAVYHLDRLERNGELVGERRGNRHRYFQANTPEARHRAGWSTLQQPRAYDLARAIADNPGVHQKSLCEGLGMNNPAASKHLAKLRDAGLVEAQRISRYVVYEPTDRLHSTLELMDQQDVFPGADGPDALDPSVV